jgi:hypothetical protein
MRGTSRYFTINSRAVGALLMFIRPTRTFTFVIGVLSY